MSDIHGEYDKYNAMLEKIGFCDSDRLHILGDICDRGKDSAKLYLDVMSRENVFCIKGNHEVMMLEMLKECFDFSLEQKEITDSTLLYNTEMWIICGGSETLASFERESNENLTRIYEFVSALPCYREITAGGKKFVLVHAGIEGFTHDAPMESYTEDSLVWYSPNFDDMLGTEPDKYYIVGHTPTIAFGPAPLPKIYFGKGNIIDIDCGAVYGGRLGCLCLETMKEFYI